MKSKRFTEFKEQALNHMFGDFIPDNKGRIDYDLSSIPEEEWIFFVAVMELMRGGLEYQKLIGKIKENQQEQFVKEDLNKFYQKTRSAFRSGKRYSFKEWINLMIDLLEELD